MLMLLREKIPTLAWEPEVIHNAIYEISEKTKLPITIAFQAIYESILGKTKGPRAGYFLSNLDKQFVLQRLTEAVK
jgi:lysyl-tRNA synthetase class 1